MEMKNIITPLGLILLSAYYMIVTDAQYRVGSQLCKF